MREAYKTQDSLRSTWLDLDHAKELEAMSRVLDANPTVAELVLQDLPAATRSASATRGAGGLSADQVLRILVVKQMNGFSYRELAFQLADSRSYRTFCRLGITDKVPTKSALNANLKALQPATLEAINRIFMVPRRRRSENTGPQLAGGADPNLSAFLGRRYTVRRWGTQSNSPRFFPARSHPIPRYRSTTGA